MAAPAPLGVGTEIVTGIAYAPQLACPKASEIITSVRDMIPDPVYDEVTDEPLPDADGSMFRARTLYRWLTAGIREVTRRANWTVMDWTAVPQVPREQIYQLDYRFVNVDGVFCNQYRLTWLDELNTLYPSYSVAQPLWYSWHHRSDHLELSLWPAPDRTDPTPALMSSLQPGTLTLDLASTTDFLPFGFVQVNKEIIQYSTVVEADPSTPHAGLRTLRRGVAGTVAGTHMAGTAVQHLSIWARGIRVPIDVTAGHHCVELPFAFQHPLETFVLAKVKEAEQDRQGASMLMQEFNAVVTDILTDPGWQTPHTVQSKAYGIAEVGGLAYGRVIVP